LAVAHAAIDLDATQGAAVLGLLERANVPPLPAYYALLYDYVAGVRGLLSSRVGEILNERDDDAQGTVRQRLYAEFVEPYQNRETLERAVSRITSRLSILDALIGETFEASHAQSASLKQASLDLTGDHLDDVLLLDLIGRLEDANVRMSQANEALLGELDTAQAELKATQAEIDHSRAGMLLDPLTGLANRGGLDIALGRLLGERTGDALACAVVDIDHFKSLNDSYGHQLGDEVLRIVSRALLVSTREGDIVGRPGGDEFLVVLPRTDAIAAREAAERMRRAIVDSDLSAVLGAGVLGGVSASIGIALFRPGDTIAAFAGRADRCLYEAKHQGRNRVVCDGDPDVLSAA
jgi:diguanylate cyclase